MSQAIILDHFNGIIPRREPTKLGPNDAQVAENVDLLSLAVKPFKKPKFDRFLSSGNVKSIFPFNNGFIEIEEDADFVNNPTSNDSFKRVFYTTATGKPKVTGVVGSAVRTFDLGVPKPTSKPTVVLQAKTVGAFTRDWEFFYEELDGTRVDKGTLVEGVDVIEATKGIKYTIASIPAKVTASADAIFIPFFQCKRPGREFIGDPFP